MLRWSQRRESAAMRFAQRSRSGPREAPGESLCAPLVAPQSTTSNANKIIQRYSSLESGIEDDEVECSSDEFELFRWRKFSQFWNRLVFYMRQVGNL